MSEPKEKEMMPFLNQFTHQYKLSKTLRFELKPCDASGKPVKGAETVADYKNSFIDQVIASDQKRATDYQTIKQVIDDYHRAHIQSALTPERGKSYLSSNDKELVNGEDFDIAYTTYCALKKDDTEENQQLWLKEKESLRKKIAKALKTDSNLFKKELITQSLPAFLEKQKASEAKVDAVTSFAQFTTYFSGFHENRKNMYTVEEQATAIPFRTINENLAKFFLNIDIYNKIKSIGGDLYSSLQDSVDSAVLEQLSVASLDALFQPSSFIHLMSQTGIDCFQTIIGGSAEQDRTKIKGLKEIVNSFTQQKTHEIANAKKEGDEELVTSLRSEEKALKRCKFIPLFKQILSEREGSSYIPEGFESDQDLFANLSVFFNRVPEYIAKIEASLGSLFPSDRETLNTIYLKTDRISELSILLYGQRAMLSEIVEKHRLAKAQKTHPITGKKASKALLKKWDSFKLEVISLHCLNGLVLDYYDELEDSSWIKDKRSIQERIAGLLLAVNQDIVSFSGQSYSSKFKTLQDKLLNVEGVKISPDRRLPSDKQALGGQGYQQIALIKEPMDDVLKIIHALAHLHLVKSRKPLIIPDADPAFYSEFNEHFVKFEQEAFELYNKARNYLSKKPYKVDKIKVNFDKSTFLAGWDVNKETDNLSVVLKKGHDYYLGIMSREHSRILDFTADIDDYSNPKKLKAKQEFKAEIEASESEEHYQKMTYKLLPGASKMLPKVFFSNARQDLFDPSAEIIEIRNHASHTKGGTPQKGFSKKEFALKDCHLMIDFYKDSIKKHPEWKQMGYRFKKTEEYADLSEFYREVEHQGYSINFENIKSDYIKKLVTEEKLFLFQIYNKDFSPFSKGKPNLHTLYWKSLFSSENLNDVVTKLNGEAEMFFRERTLSKGDTAIHKAGEKIENKNLNNPKGHSTFKYDLIKDRRFTTDKFFFHVPISLNFKATEPRQYNLKINEALADADEFCIIGIDRGERNLLAYTVINQHGEIIEKGDINQIETDQGYKVDYHGKLDAKEKQRDAARKSWGEIENIKELKAGYLSHVVHKVACLIEKHNAVVCLEDLNFGFKRGRFKVEKQVYQKFEKALIDKLNYLVFKDKEFGEAGHYLNAYQLTAPFESFQKLGKQSGLLYYITAAHTSKICPATGFVNFLDLRYKSLGRAIEFFEKVDSFHYNAEAKRFELHFNYSKMDSLAPRAPESGQQEWVLGTHGDLRYRNEKNDHGKWEPVEVNSSEEIAAILQDEAGIIAKDGADISPQLIELKNSGFKNSSRFFLRLFRALSTAFSLRQSKTGTNIDFILSPVVDQDGGYFDSRSSSLNLPTNADENGAYHIALKGLWSIGQIKSEEKFRKNVPALKNEDWIPYAQELAAKR